MTSTPSTSVKEQVLAAIKSGRFSMRPRWHFVVFGILAGIGIIATAVALLFIASFVLFSLRETGLFFIPFFGIRGILFFLTAFPWPLVLIGAGLVILLEALMRRYAFAWSRPLVYTIAAVLTLTVGGAIAVDRIQVHHTLFMQARDHRLPLAGSFYRHYGRHVPHDIRDGRIIELRPDGFRLRTREQEDITVSVSSATHLPTDGPLVVNDYVLVFGPFNDGFVHAFGIRRIPAPTPH